MNWEQNDVDRLSREFRANDVKRDAWSVDLAYLPKRSVGKPTSNDRNEF